MKRFSSFVWINYIHKCTHENKYISYCIQDSLNDSGGLICYDCLYKYHFEHISKCIPIKNDFDYYLNYYKQIIKKKKAYIENKFKEIISELEKFEKEEFKNISEFFDNSINLKFPLPIELPFIDRFEIAVNKKIKSLLDNEFYNNILLNNNYLNLFENDLKDLKFSKKNPNNNETIEINSSINFNLLGIGIPKISENKIQSIEIEIFKGHILQEKVNKFENYDNMTICILEEPIIIDKSNNYSIKVKGINNIDFINKEELYNNKSKIEITSNNSETVLACLVIE